MRDIVDTPEGITDMPSPEDGSTTAAASTGRGKGRDHGAQGAFYDPWVDIDAEPLDPVQMSYVD